MASCACSSGSPQIVAATLTHAAQISRRTLAAITSECVMKTEVLDICLAAFSPYVPRTSYAALASESSCPTPLPVTAEVDARPAAHRERHDPVDLYAVRIA